jgi:hypothetical protein
LKLIIGQRASGLTPGAGKLPSDVPEIAGVADEADRFDPAVAGAALTPG